MDLRYTSIIFYIAKNIKKFQYSHQIMASLNMTATPRYLASIKPKIVQYKLTVVEMSIVLFYSYKLQKA